MTITLEALAQIVGTQTKLSEGQTATYPVSVTDKTRYLDGTITDKVDLLWIDADRVLDATTEEIDLAGTLTDVYGDAVVFVKVCGIYIHNKQTATGEVLKVGGSAANAFLLFDNATDIYSIGPDGKLFVDDPVDGKAVTAGTGDLLKLDAGAVSSLTFDIAIWGRSA